MYKNWHLSIFLSTINSTDSMMGALMNYSTLISTAELAEHLGDPGWVICDCRFDLAAPEWGREQYRQGHIPGAVYADLNEDLSAPVVPGKTGRHPLPEVEALVRKLSEWGISAGVQVVAYDNYPEKAVTGAARLWWLLRWLGHDNVAVLDGAWMAWQQEGRVVSDTIEHANPGKFVPHPRNEMTASSRQVEAWRLDAAYRVFDSRNPDRYRGENETIDPVAGHVPGAISAPFTLNSLPDGHFQAKEALQRRFRKLLGDIPAGNAVFYCGSGVTAAYNLLALDHAGLGLGRLYAGSWSEWITDPSRPVALGSEPGNI
jgi:thiosulfate/3-mercaptopyruvate sulfurtransferase